MKKLSIFLLLVLIFSSEQAHAQNKTDTLKITEGAKNPEESKKEVNKVRISDFFIYTGRSYQRNPIKTVSDFIQISPNSELLNNDFSGFESSILSGLYSGYLYGDGHLSMSLGLSFRDASKKSYKDNILLRIGLTYSTATQFGIRLSRFDRFPYDTLISTQTNNPIYIDSINSEYYYMNYWANQVRLDGSLIFRTKRNARWSLYGGVGFNFGFSSSSTTSIFYYNNSYIESLNNSNYSVRGFSRFNDNSIFTEERKQEKSAFGFAAYVPLGLDFRVGKNNPMLRKMHLFYELRPGINYYSAPGLGGNLNSFLHSGFGIRASL